VCVLDSEQGKGDFSARRVPVGGEEATAAVLGKQQDGDGSRSKQWNTIEKRYCGFGKSPHLRAGSAGQSMASEGRRAVGSPWSAPS
jgi:hypothetical protein